MEDKSHLYLYTLDGKPIVSHFELDYSVARAYVYQHRKFLIINGKYRFFEIFYKELQYRYSLEFPSQDAFIYDLKFKDLDSNGEKDTIAITFLNLPIKQLRSKWVSVLLLKIKEALKTMQENYRMALQLEKNGDCGRLWNTAKPL